MPMTRLINQQAIMHSKESLRWKHNRPLSLTSCEQQKTSKTRKKEVKPSLDVLGAGANMFCMNEDYREWGRQ